mmetsp:Transcript_14138/g.55663  ORF Transcript_14138/g.55663 Transcript_14138/m.55663 type:complete len:222 (+) Transcript_14138:970-1635(+)
MVGKDCGEAAGDLAHGARESLHALHVDREVVERRGGTPRAPVAALVVEVEPDHRECVRAVAGFVVLPARLGGEDQLGETHDVVGEGVRKNEEILHGEADGHHNGVKDIAAAPCAERNQLAEAHVERHVREELSERSDRGHHHRVVGARLGGAEQSLLRVIRVVRAVLFVRVRGSYVGRNVEGASCDKTVDGRVDGLLIRRLESALENLARVLEWAVVRHCL